MPEGSQSKPVRPVPSSFPMSQQTPLRASKLHAAGMPKLYDPGLATTLICKSSITFLNGSAGILRYRGYPIEELATKTTFDEVAYLLLYKQLPTRSQLSQFRSRLSTPSLPSYVLSIIHSFPKSAHPMTILVSTFASLTAAFPHLNPAVSGNSVYANEQTRKEVLTIVLGLLPQLAAAILHHTSSNHQSNTNTISINKMINSENVSYTQRYFQLAMPSSTYNKNGTSVPDELIQALDTLLILHADHEQNCSTSAVRHLASSGVDIFSALSSGTAALYGPLHGGACEAVIHMLNRVGTPDNVEMFLQRVKNRQELLMGFGHRVYRTYDPRAKIVRVLVQRVLKAVGNSNNSSSNPLIKVATALEHAALNDDYFVSRKLYPNIDFYSGIIYTCMNVSPDYFGMFFALGRTAGWLAHWLEFLDDKDKKIVRPYQWFTGNIGPLPVPSIDEREKSQNDLYSAKL